MAEDFRTWFQFFRNSSDFEQAVLLLKHSYLILKCEPPLHEGMHLIPELYNLLTVEATSF